MAAPTIEKSRHFDQLGQHVRGQRQRAQEARDAAQVERDERERAYREALAVREARKTAGEGTPPREIHGWGTREGERIDEFLAFARTKGFRGCTTLQWTEDAPEQAAVQAEDVTDTRLRFGKRLLAGLRRNRTVTVPEEVMTEPEQLVTHQMRAYDVGYAGNSIAYLCEDGALRQVNPGVNPEPLNIISPYSGAYDRYAGQAKEPSYDRRNYDPIMVQLDNLAKRHLIG